MKTQILCLTAIFSAAPGFTMAEDKECWIEAYVYVVRSDDTIEPSYWHVYQEYAPTLYLATGDQIMVQVEMGGGPCPSGVMIECYKDNVLQSSTAYSGMNQILFSDPGYYYVSYSYSGYIDYVEPAAFYIEQAPVLSMQLGVLLGGAYDVNSGIMRDDLRAAGLVPMNRPAIEPQTNGQVLGSPSTTAALLAVTGGDAIVDWVRIELRPEGTPDSIPFSTYGLVQRDGDIVSPNGSPQLSIVAPAGNYHIAIRHRNHLGAMTASAFTLSTSTTVIDFRQSGLALFGTDAMKTVNGSRMLWAGNSRSDSDPQTIKYVGSTNDRDQVLSWIGGATPNSTVSGQYGKCDVNMDGVIKYTGANNDRDLILQTIGGNMPTNTREEQISY